MGCPFMNVLLMPFAGNHFKIVLRFDCHKPLSVFSYLTGIVTCRQEFPRLRMTLPCIGKANVGISAQRQEFFLSCETVFIAPPLAAAWLYQQKQAAAIR